MIQSGAEAHDVCSIATLLRGYSYNIGSESDFKRGALEVLLRSGVDAVPEYDLGPDFGRIDLYVQSRRLGIELKLKASPSEILRQLHRYAQCPIIASLVLLTSRCRLNPVPSSICGKQLQVISIWEGLL